MPEELSDDDVGEGADEVHEAPVGGVVQPVVPRRRVVALELARRRVAEEDHLQEKRREPGLYHGPCLCRDAALPEARCEKGLAAAFHFCKTK